jgi:hypothetical protein
LHDQRKGERRRLLIDERPDRRPPRAEEGGDPAGSARSRRPPRGEHGLDRLTVEAIADAAGRLPAHLLELLPEQGGGAPLERPGPDGPLPRARRRASAGRAALAGDVRGRAGTRRRGRPRPAWIAQVPAADAGIRRCSLSRSPGTRTPSAALAELVAARLRAGGRRRAARPPARRRTAHGRCASPSSSGSRTSPPRCPPSHRALLLAAPAEQGQGRADPDGVSGSRCRGGTPAPRPARTAPAGAM